MRETLNNPQVNACCILTLRTGTRQISYSGYRARNWRLLRDIHQHRQQKEKYVIGGNPHIPSYHQFLPSPSKRENSRNSGVFRVPRKWNILYIQHTTLTKSRIPGSQNESCKISVCPIWLAMLGGGSEIACSGRAERNFEFQTHYTKQIFQNWRPLSSLSTFRRPWRMMRDCYQDRPHLRENFGGVLMGAATRVEFKIRCCCEIHAKHNWKWLVSDEMWLAVTFSTYRNCE